MSYCPIKCVYLTKKITGNHKTDEIRKENNYLFAMLHLIHLLTEQLLLQDI